MSGASYLHSEPSDADIVEWVGEHYSLEMAVRVGLVLLEEGRFSLHVRHSFIREMRETEKSLSGGVNS